MKANNNYPKSTRDIKIFIYIAYACACFIVTSTQKQGQECLKYKIPVMYKCQSIRGNASAYVTYTCQCPYPQS